MVRRRLLGIIHKKKIRFMTKKQKKRYKDEEFLEYTIKIRRVRKVWGNRYCKEYKDKFYLVEIKQPSGHGISFAVPIKRNIGAALRKVFREIKHYLCL
ncbi:MAG: hypothetical protein ACTSR2_00455 [Candidatus Hodarchaeales archaeon]